MENTTNVLRERLKQHWGHHVVISAYGDTDNPCMALECEDCNEVLFSSDMYDVQGISEQDPQPFWNPPTVVCEQTEHDVRVWLKAVSMEEKRCLLYKSTHYEEGITPFDISGPTEQDWQKAMEIARQLCKRFGAKLQVYKPWGETPNL